MKNFLSGAILFATLTALVYATNDVWPKVEYERWVGATRMDTDP